MLTVNLQRESEMVVKLLLLTKLLALTRHLLLCLRTPFFFFFFCKTKTLFLLACCFEHVYPLLFEQSLRLICFKQTIYSGTEYVYIFIVSS